MRHNLKRVVLRGAGLMVLMVASLSPAGVWAQGPAYVEPPPGKMDAPRPVTFPADDGPHDAAIEWWYYTGHVFSETGERYGFEQVVFKGAPDGVPGFASHAAITDSANDRFVYDQKIAGPSALQAGPGFNIVMDGWVMRGAGGRDRLRMTVPGYEMAVTLTQAKSPTLHDGDGFIDYGKGQGSYYYSRTRMQLTGTLVIDGSPVAVTGEVWMDHQWGDFSTFDQGGWDWFSVQLEDGTDLMLYLIRGPEGDPVILDGSMVDTTGQLTTLDGPDFTVEAAGTWTSPDTGTTYPATWSIRLPQFDLELTLVPSVANQELDTTHTTGQVYWEGEVVVDGSRRTQPVAGLGYVELTGYAD